MKHIVMIRCNSLAHNTETLAELKPGNQVEVLAGTAPNGLHIRATIEGNITLTCPHDGNIVFQRIDNINHVLPNVIQVRDIDPNRTYRKVRVKDGTFSFNSSGTFWTEYEQF